MINEFVKDSRIYIVYRNGCDSVYLENAALEEFGNKKFITGTRISHSNQYLGGCKQVIDFDFVASIINLGEKSPDFGNRTIFQRLRYFFTGSF